MVVLSTVFDRPGADDVDRAFCGISRLQDKIRETDRSDPFYGQLDSQLKQSWRRFRLSFETNHWKGGV